MRITTPLTTAERGTLRSVANTLAKAAGIATSASKARTKAEAVAFFKQITKTMMELEPIKAEIAAFEPKEEPSAEA